MSLNGEDADVVVALAVDGAFEVPEWLRNAQDAWREGDLEMLRRILVDPRTQKYPHEHYYLLVERNRDWIPFIERMLRNEPVGMVLFGAAQLVGDYDVLELLRRKGYRIENLYQGRKGLRLLLGSYLGQFHAATAAGRLDLDIGLANHLV